MVASGLDHYTRYSLLSIPPTLLIVIQRKYLGLAGANNMVGVEEEAGTIDLSFRAGPLYSLFATIPHIYQLRFICHK
ncbi:hypothetical protein J6590_053233, partial [Homalodisca vitripennis]